MNALMYVTDFIVPVTIFLILIYGWLERVKVYDEFVNGAKSGFFTVIKLSSRY